MAGTIAIVGGGIAGLTVAFETLELASTTGADVEVLCLEGSRRPGGNIRTERVDGYLCEWGPNGFLDNAPATVDLVRRLGLEATVLSADPGAERRFVLRDGRLREIPTRARSFLTSDVLSWRGRLRVLSEPLR